MARPYAAAIERPLTPRSEPPHGAGGAACEKRSQRPKAEATSLRALAALKRARLSVCAAEPRNQEPRSPLRNSATSARCATRWTERTTNPLSVILPFDSNVFIFTFGFLLTFGPRLETSASTSAATPTQKRSSVEQQFSFPIEEVVATVSCHFYD